jgi:hypothetical protein
MPEAPCCGAKTRSDCCSSNKRSLEKLNDSAPSAALHTAAGEEALAIIVGLALGLKPAEPQMDRHVVPARLVLE